MQTIHPRADGRRQARPLLWRQAIIIITPHCEEVAIMSKRGWVILALVVMSTAAGCKKGSFAFTSGATSQKPSPALPSAGTNLSLQTAYDNATRAMKRVIELFDSVKDDASAQAAGGPLRLAATELAAALKQMKLTVAALDTAGRKQEIDQFYQNLAVKGVQPAGLDRFQPAVERVVQSPQGPKLRSEINAVLDGVIENVSVKEREHLQRWIQEKNLRQ
jgi:hypothetical protein